MAVSYKKLFHLLIERDMTTAQLQHQAFFSTTIPKPGEQITETDVRYLLTMQLSGLIEKEREEQRNGQ